MKPVLRNTLVFSLVLMSLVACATSKEPTKVQKESTELQKRVHQKVEQLRETAARATRPLRLYPDDMREAVLETCRDPALIVRMLDARGTDSGRLDAILEDYPSFIQEAARKLAGEQEILTILSENLVIAGLVGALYADDPDGIKRLLAAKAKAAEKQEKEVTADWQERLEGDPEAMKEMETATKAYQEEVGASAGETASTPSGTKTSASGTTVVYAAPSYSYTVYVMDHCDWYYHLCGHMYYHSHYYGWYYDDYWDDYWDERHEAREDWQRHFEETREDRQEYRKERREEFRENHGETLEQAGNGGMSEAVKDWKEKNGDSLPKDFFKEDGKIAERFKQFGESERSFREGVKSGHYREGDRKRVMKRSLSEPRREVARERRAPSRERRSIERGQMSRNQRMDRARGAHRSSWGSGSRRGSYSRGGGMRGGGRRGGGRR
jgi:uncharacterized membrane protein YgcG